MIGAVRAGGPSIRRLGLVMAEDPYQPPAASLTASALPARRPIIIWTAIILIGASFALGLTVIFLEDGFPNSIGSVIGMLAFVIFTMPLALGLLVRRNWIRWLVIGILVLGYVLPPWPNVVPRNDLDSAIYILQIVFQALAVVLLVLPASDRWYRPSKSFNPNPRGSA